VSDKARYVEIKERTRAELEKSFASGDPNVVSEALYSAAQHEQDRRRSQTQCLKMLNHESLLVRSSALTALGEIALFRGNLALDVVLPAMKRFENESSL
jgi:HEAT repeat protein